MSPEITVMMPRPPIWIRQRMTACPKMLHEVTVGTTTRPVTHVAVVEVKSASIKGVKLPVADDIGSMSKSAPIKIAAMKLSNII